MLAHAFDLALVRNTSCSTSQSVSLVSIAQLFPRFISTLRHFFGASDFEFGKELSV